MTRRMLGDAIWQNEKFGTLCAGARLLLIGMITTADDQGRGKAHLAYLRAQIFPYDDYSLGEIAGWLQSIEANGTMRLYTVEGKDYYQMLNWWEYQAHQFAMPSEYPKPPGWRDRVRKSAGKVGIICCNWVAPSGALLPDSCDEQGAPLVAYWQLGSKLGAQLDTKLGTQLDTQLDVKLDTQDQDQDQDLDHEVIGDGGALTSPTLVMADRGEVQEGGAHSPTLAGAGSAGELLATFTDDQLRQAAYQLGSLLNLHVEWTNWPGWLSRQSPGTIVHLLEWIQFYRNVPPAVFDRIESLTAVIRKNLKDKARAPLAPWQRQQIAADIQDALFVVQEV